MPDVPKMGQTIYEQAAMLDTGPLVSLYHPRDNRGEDVALAIRHMQQEKYPVCITLLTIAETHRRILYDIGCRQATLFLTNIFDGNINVIQINEEDINDAIKIIERYPDQSITFTDAVSMAVMKRIGIQKVMSYDQHFRILNFITFP